MKKNKAMKKIKRIGLLALLGIAYKVGAQMVVTNPTQDFILVESKIETASNWMQQINGLTQTIDLARKHANKLDSTKRAVEKAYQLQDDVRKDATNAYNAVKDLSVDNLAHITENYLGFSINPEDYLPNMPGLDGYSEFRKSLDYDAGQNIASNTAAIDRFLSSVVLTETTASIDNPTYDYFRRLDQINNLAGAYGSFYLYRKKSDYDQRLIDMAKSESMLEFFRSSLEEVKNPADLVAIWNALLAEEARVKAEREKAKQEAQDLLDAGVRVANIQEIVKEKQKDIIILTAAITTHYNQNKNFSLRKLANSSTNKTAYNKVRQKNKDDLDNLKKQ
jgi:hypothetical protein